MSIKLLKPLTSTIERVAGTHGYRVSWAPRILLENTKAELSFSMEFVIAHLMLKKRDIFFIQIGANDGVANDPLYKFVIEYPWRGVLVEPLPAAFEMLKENYKGRPNLHFINAAVSENDGFRPLYTIPTVRGKFRKAHQFSSFKKETVEQQIALDPNVGDRVEEVQVRCISMGTLLREAGDEAVDILQIDAEGYDFEILKMIDFSTFRPSIICYEHTQMTKGQQEEVADLLVGQGYRFTKDSLDAIAYRPVTTYGWR